MDPNTNRKVTFSASVISLKATFPNRKLVPHKHPAAARDSVANFDLDLSSFINGNL